MTLAPPDRRRATWVGIVNQYGSIALMLLQGVLLVPLYLRCIDRVTYGAWLATGNIVAWLGFLDPGVSGVIQQRIGHAYGRRDRSHMAMAIGTGVLLNLAFAALVGLAGIAAAPFVPRITRLSGPLATRLATSFALAAAAEGTLLAALALAGVLIALMAYPATLGLTYFLCTATGIFATVVFLRYGVGVASIPLGLLVRAVALLCANTVLVLHVVWRRLGIRPKLSRVELRAIFGLSGYTWLSRLGAMLLSSVDTLLVARVMGPAAVLPLVLTRRPADLIGQATARVGVAFVPAITHVHGEGDTVALRRISVRLVRLVGWLAALGLGGYVGLNRAFMALWVGHGIYGGRSLTLLLGLMVTWQAIGSVLSGTLFALGSIRTTSITSICEAIVRVAVVATLLKLGAGLVGVPLAALAGGLGVSATVLAPRFGRALGMTPPETRAVFMGLAAQAALLAATGIAWDRLAPRPLHWTGVSIEAVGLAVIEVCLLMLASPAARAEAVGLTARVGRV